MARRKAGDNQVQVGNVTRVSGKVTIAGGDIYEGYTAEQVSLLLTQITSNYQRKPFDGRCPYKGLEVFEEEDAEFFFGRERLVDDLLHRVKESRTVFITGPSGSGKSSLVRAGLIHALKQGAIKSLHSERWLVETMKPGREPIKDLALAFSRLKSPDLAKYFQAHANEINVLNECAESVLSGRKDQRFVLFIDQFEEVFTQVSRAGERLAFLNMLAHAADVENGRVVILFAMRSDFISNCAAYPKLNALLNQQFVQIGSMQPEELVSAIALPAKQVGLPIEDELVARIINDMKGEPGALPLMQFALKDLFDSQQTKGGLIALRLDDYLGHGGIHKSLERHADASFAKLNEDEQGLARSIFSGLIEIGRGRQDTRRTALFEELIPADTKAEDVFAVVGKLADARLIITDEQAGKDTVTIAHEKLIDAWPWLKKLVNENRDAIALQNEIASDAKEWADHRRDPSYLYTGARLANAREQLESQKLVLSDLAQKFVQAGRTRQQRGQWVALTAVSAVIALLIFAVFAFRNQAQINIETANTAQAASTFAVAQQGTAQANEKEAQKQTQIALVRQLAAQAIARLNNQPDLALLLSAEAFQRRDAFETRDSLLTGLLYSPNLVAFLHNPEDFASDGVNALTFSPDGKTLAIGSGTGNLALWDTSSHQIIESFTENVGKSKGGSYSTTVDLRFGSGGKSLEVLDAYDGWSSIDLQTQKVISGKVLGVEAANFADRQLSLDGKLATVPTPENTIAFFDMTSHQIVSQLPASDLSASHFLSTALSPDGKLLAVSSTGYDLSLWNVTTLQKIGTLREATNQSGLPGVSVLPDGGLLINGPIASPVTGIAFSQDGKTLAAGDESGVVKIWDISSLQQIGESQSRGTSTFEDRITKLAFSPDGQKIAAARGTNIDLYYTNVIKDGFLEPISFSAAGHTGAIQALAFSPDGRYLATGGRDGMAILWDLIGNQSFGLTYLDPKTNTPKEGSLVGLSSDGNKLVALDSKEITFWSTATRQKLISLHPEHWLSNGLGPGAILSPDDKTLAVADNDYEKKVTTLFLWDVRTKKRMGSPLEQAGHIIDMAFAPNNKWLATIYFDDNSDYKLVLWDITTGHILNTDPLNKENESVYALAFHPNGKLLYIAASRGLLQFDLETSHVNSLHDGFFNVLAITPNGKLLAAASSSQKTITLWNTANGQPFGKALVGHTDSITRLAFNSDGSLLASAGQDGLRLWDIATQQLMGPPLVEGMVSNVAFNQSKEHSVLVSDGEAIRQWPMDSQAWLDRACQIANRNLTQAEWEKYFGEELYRRTCADLPVDRSVIQAVIDAGVQLADAGRFEEALAKFQAAFQMDPDFPADRDTLNTYCWFGSIYGFARDALPYCEKAVKADPKDAAIRDSRGLARALTGDYSGAIEDFQFFVDEGASQGNNEYLIRQRQQWIIELKAGKNPFTPEILQQLKDQ